MKKNVALLLTILMTFSILSVNTFGASQVNPTDSTVTTSVTPTTNENANAELTTNITDVKIGVQDQSTTDIVITETKAGMLMEGKTVAISITDSISVDIPFSPDVKVEVTSGDLEIENIRTTSNGYANTSGSSFGTGDIDSEEGGTIRFDIKESSTVPSTITISNVSVKVDRTVPLSNDRPYDVVIWGSAIAQNFGYNDDEFSKAGISMPYLRVVSSTTDINPALTQEIRVTEGQSFYTVNGVSYDMDAAAYISETSNSMMVPVRFVANAFGLNDNEIIWDDANDTVTLIIPRGKTVQFKVGSSTEIVNGMEITMYSPDMKEVMPENVDGRVYVPFRAVGDAFGVDVEWDEATRTAIYNSEL